MIVEWLVSLVLGQISSLLALLPTADRLTFDLGPAFGVMRTFNAIIPVDAAFSAFAAVATVLGVLFVLGLIRQVWRFVPIIGGG